MAETTRKKRRTFLYNNLENKNKFKCTLSGEPILAIVLFDIVYDLSNVLELNKAPKIEASLNWCIYPHL